MGQTLNPNLLAKDSIDLLNNAAELMDRYRKKNIFPEMALMALIEAKDTPGYALLQRFAASDGLDLSRLARQTRLSVESRRDLPGDLAFVTKNNKQVPLSRQMIIAIDEALTVAENSNEVYIRTDHLLAAMSQQRLGTGGILQQHGLNPRVLTEMITGKTGTKPASTSTVARQMGGTAVDYVALAKAGERRPVYYREALLTELMNMLSQKVNRHVILLGQEGVGKRTLTYSLALLMAEGKGPAGLKNLVQVDETALLDNPVRAIRAGINRAQGGILFVPQIHRFFDQQTRLRQPKVPADLQKVFLGEDPVIIGTTTEATYNEQLATLAAIHEHSQRLRIPEPGEQEATAILDTLKPQLAADYSITVADDALKIAVSLARRYMSGTPLPRSAENLLHRAAALVNMSAQQHIAFKPDSRNGADNTLDAEDVTLAASQMTGIPVSKLGEDERNRYASMVEHLHDRIIGQDEAVMAVSRAVKTARVGLKDKKRPIGGFLFLGPTGVGKTELAKALAEFMFGDEDAMLQLDMSEFQNESTVNRLIGSPSGYVDSEAGGQLTERVRQQPYLIVLFDEIEKAHPRVLDILLQVLEEGRLTDGRGNTANFSETVIIMTSNLGATYLQTTEITEDIRDSVMDAVDDHFRPEFLNRLDEIVIFHPLNNDHLAQILDLMLKKENKLASTRGLTLEFGDRAKEWMLEQNDHPEWGARPLRRIIRQYLREPLADKLLTDNPPAGTTIKIDLGKNGLTFTLSAAE